MAKKKMNVKPNDFGLNVKRIKSTGYTHMECSRSGEILPLSEFRIYKNHKEFLSYCKDVEREYMRTGYPERGNTHSKKQTEVFENGDDSNSTIRMKEKQEHSGGLLSQLRSSTKNNKL